MKKGEIRERVGWSLSLCRRPGRMGPEHGFVHFHAPSGFAWDDELTFIDCQSVRQEIPFPGNLVELMAIIGTFKLGADGSYAGEIRTLTLSRKARLVPIETAAANAPNLRVYSGLAEIGVAWEKASKGGNPYFAVKLDDPSFAAPVWANLVASTKDAAVFNLLWDRPRPQAE